MNLVKTFGLCLAVAFVCSVSVAQESECSKCPSTCSKCPTETVATSADQEKSCCGGCAVAKAMKALPVMTYKVGDESVCCSESAAAMAKKHDKPMHYVVGKKTFESKEKAYTALVESTEKFVNEFVTPKKMRKKRQDINRRCKLWMPNGCWQESRIGQKSRWRSQNDIRC